MTTEKGDGSHQIKIEEVKEELINSDLLAIIPVKKEDEKKKRILDSEEDDED